MTCCPPLVPRLLLLALLSLVFGCEAIAKFDRDKLDPMTEPPIVIPARDAGVRPDAGDASEPEDAANDAELDASQDADVADGDTPEDGSLDGELSDGASDAELGDAEISEAGADAGLEDAATDADSADAG